jgi:CheY-like chemotaxis protein
MTLVQAKFKALQPDVVLLETTNGREAVLNRSEIDDAAVLNAADDAAVHAYFKRDPFILVLVSEPKGGDAPLHAVRQLLLRDSRLKECLGYRLGQTKRLIIRDATSKVFAYGDLAEGVAGRCRKRDIRRYLKEHSILPAKPVDEKYPVTAEMLKTADVEDDDFWSEYYPEFTLQAADTVLGCISGFEYLGAGDDIVAVELDIAAFISQLELHPNQVCKHLGCKDREGITVFRKDEAQTAATDECPQVCGTVLFVDDDMETVLRPIRDLLRQGEYDVETASSASDAKGVVRKVIDAVPPKTISVAFIDIHLTHDLPNSSYEGIAFARWLQEQVPGCGIILMSAEGIGSVNSQKQRLCGDLRVVACEDKPLSSKRIKSLIQDALSPTRALAADLLVATPDRSRSTVAGTRQIREDAAKTTTKLLEDAKARLGADAVHLFRLHVVTRVADILHSAGCHFPRFRTNQRGLCYSPVRDVCERGEAWCHIGVPTMHEGKHRKLLALCDFSRKYHVCVACPVSPPPGDEYLYGLFAFFFPPKDTSDWQWKPESLVPGCPAGTPTQAREQLAMAILGETAQSISRERSVEWHLTSRAKEDPVFMAGMLAVKLGHELFHCLQGAEHECAALEPQIAPNIVTTQKDVEIMRRLHERTTRAVEIARNLARQARLDAEASGPFDAVAVLRAAARTASLASRNVAVTCATSPPVTLRGQAGKFECIVHNLILNAVQQTALSLRRGGSVYVRHGVVKEGERPGFVVQVFDNGPGIHGFMKERIFEPGVTSRPDATGMGLTICRQDMARLGLSASVRIAESILWVGSCVEAVFPLDMVETEETGAL